MRGSLNETIESFLICLPFVILLLILSAPTEQAHIFCFRIYGMDKLFLNLKYYDVLLSLNAEKATAREVNRKSRFLNHFGHVECQMGKGQTRRLSFILNFIAHLFYFCMFPFILIRGERMFPFGLIIFA